MNKSTRKRALSGAVFAPLSGAKRHESLPPSEELEITVVLRRRVLRERLYDDEYWSALPSEREVQASSSDYHARESDLALVETFALEHDLEVVSKSARRRTVVLRGPARAIGRAFAVELVRYRHETGDHRGFEGQVHVPEELAEVVMAVLGLHDRPVSKPALATAPTPVAPRLTIGDLAELYEFPEEASGRGQRIGIIELGGGYRERDLDTFFESLGIARPSVSTVEVDGAGNEPEDEEQVRATMEWLAAAVESPATAGNPPPAGGATVEVTMDIEIAGALAPGAEIVVYFARPTERSLFNVLHDALQPGGPSVLSLSWSWNERPQDQDQAQIEDLLERCAVDGRTLCVGSGDRGSRGSPSDGPKSLNPQFPAISPYVLACGGTRLEIRDGRLVGEKAWNSVDFGQSTGGGVSRVSPLPRWQAEAQVPARPDGWRGRGIPDVAAVADPETHCGIFVGGTWGPAAGTSASAPLWAALVARLNELLGVELGYSTPLFYRLARERPDVFRDVVCGTNGAYKAAAGWDPCTGLGGPRGTRLLNALRGE